MKNYTIYWIQEEIGNHFFHKCDVLYRFFKTYENENNRVDLNGQFRYITKDVPKELVRAYIKNYYRNTNSIKMNGDTIEIYTDRQYISLHIHQKHIKFQCDMLHEAESLLFPTLRAFQPFLFIIGNENYGWISPVTKKREQKLEQVLYSFL
ncbi:sporulation inhibitor of replication protein SirA [Virgibacillus byunsanensis]|uniref:Sporulation inhibitor of replication protein SirA n=1 Tax=Virgibacillus byunsanensis TaxID=570945 RepID=A0ABW3LHQ8_9BACI